MSLRKKTASLATCVALAVGMVGAPVAQAQQNGLVNVEIGDVTILRNVDVALAANVVANVCALVEADVLVLANQVDAGTIDDFTCNQRGSGRAVAITDD
jgi:hypothetical protein